MVYNDGENDVSFSCEQREVQAVDSESRSRSEEVPGIERTSIQILCGQCTYLNIATPNVRSLSGQKKSSLLERNNPFLEIAIHSVDKNVIDILSIF